MALRGTLKHLRKRLKPGGVTEPPLKLPRTFVKPNLRGFHTVSGYSSEEPQPGHPFSDNSAKGNGRIWDQVDSARKGNAPCCPLIAPRNSVEVRTNIPTFGSGLFATKDLDVGETVIEEKPFLRFSWDRLYQGWDNRNFVRRFNLHQVQPEWRGMAVCIIQAFAYAGRANYTNPLDLNEFQALVATRRASDELANVLEKEILPVVQRRFNPKFTSKQLNELYSKIASNAYRNGLYCMISKINHSCHPNTCFKPYQNGRGQVVLSGRTVVATTSITKGDQLFISYADCDGFDLSLLGELGIRCMNDPEDFEITSKCACCVGRDLSVVRRIFNISR